MIKSDIETMRAGLVLPKHCQCGHLKDHHLSTPMTMEYIGEIEVLQCQDYVFDTNANKFIQCGCRI